MPFPRFLSALLPKAALEEGPWAAGAASPTSLLLSCGSVSIVNHLHVSLLLSLPLGNPAEDCLQKHFETLQVKHRLVELLFEIITELTVQILHLSMTGFRTEQEVKRRPEASCSVTYSAQSASVTTLLPALCEPRHHQIDRQLSSSRASGGRHHCSVAKPALFSTQGSSPCSHYTPCVTFLRAPEEAKVLSLGQGPRLEEFLRSV